MRSPWPCPHGPNAGGDGWNLGRTKSSLPASFILKMQLVGHDSRVGHQLYSKEDPQASRNRLSNPDRVKTKSTWHQTF